LQCHINAKRASVGVRQSDSERELNACLRDKVKLQRAHGGCLGNERRRRTWTAAISFGEPLTGFDPEISEWDNPRREYLPSEYRIHMFSAANLGN
jgi:hypothetical protein